MVYQKITLLVNGELKCKTLTKTPDSIINEMNHHFCGSPLKPVTEKRERKLKGERKTIKKLEIDDLLESL